jgi:hypothetical protein
VFVAASPWIGFIVAQTRRGRRWWTGLPSLLCQVMGAGMALNVAIALIGSVRTGGTFIRTPKHHIVHRGQEWRDQAYVRVGDPRAVLEAAFGLGAFSIVPLAVATAQPVLAVYSALFALGFLTVAGLSLVDLLEVFTLRRLGRHALSRIRLLTPAVTTIAVAAVLLLLATRVREPFEDGYGHWLLAATLASTGHLHDPIFGMEDTWLPGYHVIAAIVLRLFGLWQLGALKVVSALFGVITVVCVYSLAPNPRQARLATALLVLNPVFLFTSGSAVVEPMLTALVTGAGLAAVRGRMKLAAILLAIASATSTKAWLWLAAALAFALFTMARSWAVSRPRTAVVWAVPALAALVFLPLGLGPASHSLARGSVEVVSASARGSIAADSIDRLFQVTTTFGLATLPVLLFGIVGAALALRGHASSLWRFVHVPAIVYLGAVFGLVAAGAYSGSHRYLYLALPSLALLGAAGVDRYVAPIRLGAVGASIMLAIGFLPVFTGFANDNAGLIEAGRAAQGRPGVLMTDSPVVAFYSRKPPGQIIGSRSLPGDRLQALEWLEKHQVTTLVLEDISYYRATSTFPDLSRGMVSAPFQALGDEQFYQVAGGKAVYAYRLDDTPISRPIGGSIQVALWPMPAEGKTASLAKGLSLRVGIAAGAGEGMGFGVPIVRFADGWVYPRTSSDTDLSTETTTIWRRTFELDEIGGDAAHRYAFASITSRGQIQVTYTIDATGLMVVVAPIWLAAGASDTVILNEQSAAFDDLAADGQPTLTGDAFGNWIPVHGSWARLRSASLRSEWSLPSIRGASMFAGREFAPPDFDWAGLDYIFNGRFTGAAYHIQLQGAR